MNSRRRPSILSPPDRRRTSLVIGACCVLIVTTACGGGGGADSPSAVADTATSVAPQRTPTTPATTTPRTTNPATTTPATTTTTGPSGPVVDWENVERADPSVFDYEPVRPVAYEVTGERFFRGYEMQRIVFDSPAGGTATGYLSTPESDPVGVGILWGHGAPSDGKDSFPPMSVFACAGVTSIVVDAPYARPVDPVRSEPSFMFTPQDRDEQIQLVVDMRRALDLLTDLGAERLGFGGISYGSAIGGLLLGVDQRPEVGVLLLGNGGAVERFTDESGVPIWPLSTRSDDEIRVWVEAMLPIEPIHFVGDSTADLLFMSGDADSLVPPAEAERFHAAAPEGAELYWMDEAHDIPFEDMYLHNRWLGDRLGVDPDRLDSCLTEIFPNGWSDL